MYMVGCYFDKNIKCNRCRITTSSSLLFIGNTDIIKARLNSVIVLFSNLKDNDELLGSRSV